MSYFHHNNIIIGGLRCSLCCYACSYTYIEAAASSRVCVCVGQWLHHRALLVAGLVALKELNLFLIDCPSSFPKREGGMREGGM